MQKGQQYLRFGQIIRIHGHKCLQHDSGIGDDNDMNYMQQQMHYQQSNRQIKLRAPGNTQKQQTQIRGMIAVKGFTDKDAKYLPFKHFKNCEFYRQTLFQILPRGHFEKSDSDQHEIKKRELYQELCKEKLGEYVKFGQDVVFRHVDSLDYLSGSVRCSDGGLGAFKVQLSDQLLINLVFKLYPFRSFEKQGDKIKLESPLRIKNISNRCYISTEKNQNRYSIVTTYSQAFTWLIHLHETHETLNDIDQIRTHDILYLAHTKNDGYLCIDKKRQGKGACIKKPLQDTGYHCFTCLWQIQKLSVPKISPYQQSDKNHLGTEGTYSLRQLLTGEYIEISKLMSTAIQNKSIDDWQITIKSAKGLPNVSDYLKHLGLVKIGGPKGMKEGQIDAAQQVTAESSELNYRQVSPYKVYEVGFSESESQHGFRIIKIDDQSKRQVLFILSTYEVLDQFKNLLILETSEFQKQVRSKKIEEIDLTLQKLIAFVKNCSMKEIEKDVLPIKKRQFICMDVQICARLFQILKSMGKKILEQIYKTSKVENQSFKTAFNRAYYLIWQIIKNNPITKLYVCESWFDIIQDHAIQNEEETVLQTLSEILQSNELVVTKFLKANNNHLVQRIIDVFTLKPPHQKFLNIFRASCMSNGAPIVGNQKLILNVFFKQLDPVSKFHFLTSVNQHDELIKDQIIELEGEEKPQVELKIQKIYIECHISKAQKQRRSLKQFFEDSSRLDLSQTSNYFIAYLNLLADICFGRNTEAKNYVEEILVPQNVVGFGQQGEGNTYFTSLDTLIGILQDQQMKTVKGSNNLLRAVIRLINYAYVVSADQNPVLRINRYRNVDPGYKPQAQIKVGPKFNKVMKFIKDKLSKFESFFSIQINENDPDKKQKQLISLQEKMLMLTVLQLLKSTLIIGYWTIKQQQNELVPLLLNILKNKKEDILHYKENLDLPEHQLKQFEKFKKQVSQLTPSMEIIIMCKALACELIQTIFDFRHDNLVTECVNFYKLIEGYRKQSIFDQRGVAIQLDLTQTKSNIDAHPLYKASSWREKMQQIFEQPSDNDSDKVKSGTKLMNPLMVELSIHKNPILFFRSLKIMKRHFEYRVDILKLFLGLSIYDNQNGSELAKQINENRSLLGKLQEENLLYSKSNEKDYHPIMQFLVGLSQAIKQGTNLEVAFEKLDFRHYVNIFCHFNEESRINKFHQRLIKNMDLHPILLNFIGLSKQPLSQFKGEARLVLKYVYRFLALLAKSFNEAKSQMIHMKDRIFNHVQQQCQNITSHNQLPILYTKGMDPHEQKQKQVLLENRDDCQAIQLLAELFSNNKHIIYNEVMMEQVSIDISQMINTVPIINYYKSHLLDFFRTMLYFKDKHIVVNQSRILAKLQDSKKKYIFYRVIEKKQQIKDKTKKLEDRENIGWMNQDQQDDEIKGFCKQQLIKLISKWEDINPDLMKITQPTQQYPLRKHQQKSVVILPELTYYITMTNLFANLVEGQHIVNIGKCRQVHTYSQLMNIMWGSSICYPLKTHLRNYINQLYYSTKIEEDLCSEIIQIEIPLFIEDLNKLIIILSKQREGKWRIVHPIKYKYYDTYIYLYTEQIVYSLNYLQQDETFIKEMLAKLASDFSRGYYYLHYYIMRIYERLRWLLNYYYQHRYLRGFLNKVTNKMKQTFLIPFKQTMWKVFDRNEQKLHSYQSYSLTQNRAKRQINQIRIAPLMKRAKDLMHKLVKGQMGNYFTEDRPERNLNFPLTFCLPYGDQSQNAQEIMALVSSNRDEELSKIAEKLKIILVPNKQNAKQKKDYHHLKLTKLEESLHNDDQFKKFMMSFKTSQCNELYEIDQFSFNYYEFNQKFVSFEEYIKIFVKVNTEEPESISNDLKIFFFEVLLQYIVRFNKNPSNIKSIELWKKQDWEDYREEIMNAQKFLNKANVAELIIETLKNSDDINLSSYVLLFGIGYLMGGNTQCQNSVLQKLKEDTKNEVFIKIQKIISRLGKKITSRISERTNHVEPKKDEFVVQSLDLYDYYDERVRAMKREQNDEKHTKDEEDEQKIQKYVFSRLFKFLQLLCECNNFELKHFVRIQTNNDGTKKNYSFNVINMTTFEIRRLFKVMSEEASKVVEPLTDFLNEVVTVPCIENQISLCQTTFFEDLCFMASIFKQQKMLKQRGLDTKDSLERLFGIYQKCILILLNVLEGNDSQLNQSLLVKVDVTFLLGIIEQNLEILNIKNRADLLNVLSNKDKQTQKVPVQLENAMNVMIVLQKLQASEGSENFIEKKRAYLLELFKGKGFNLEQLLKALRQQMLKIEVISSNGKQFIYFPKHPILTKLSGATKDRIMGEVSRSTQRQKIKSLFTFKQEIFTQIHHNFKIQKERFLCGLITFEPSTMVSLQQYSFWSSYLVIALWFFSTDIQVKYGEVFYEEPDAIRPLLFTLNLMQLMITFAYFISYFKCKFELAKFRAKKHQEQTKQENQRLRAQLGYPENEEDKDNRKIGLFKSLQNLLSRALNSSSLFIIIKFDEKFKFVLLYLITSIIGTFFTETAYLIYIVYFFLENDTLSNVFNAIFYNLNQLFSVGVLGVVFVYIFSLICYETYALNIMRSKFNDIERQRNSRKKNIVDDSCDTIFDCIMDLFVSGNIGGSMKDFQFVRFITDLIYFIFFGLLFGNIVSGIMIDTFAELRNKRQQMNDDKKNKCYICGKDRATVNST